MIRLQNKTTVFISLLFLVFFLSVGVTFADYDKRTSPVTISTNTSFDDRFEIILEATELARHKGIIAKWSMIQYSTDGRNWSNIEVNGDTLLSPETNIFDLILCSELENVWYNFRARSWINDLDAEEDSLLTYWVEEQGAFNMAPSPVSNLTCSVEGFDISISFNSPTTNMDGSELIDFSHYTLWMLNDEDSTEVANFTETEYSLSVDTTGVYNFTITAHDDNGNCSGNYFARMAGDASLATSFEDDEWNRMIGNSLWQHGNPIQGEAYSGQNALWVNTNYNHYFCDRYFVSRVFKVTEEDAFLSYYHTYNYIEDTDGYNVTVSTDQGLNYSTILPLNGYSGESISTLEDQPGFNGDSNGWQRTVFPLSDFVGDTLIVRFNHGDEANSGGEITGVAIDDMIIDGVELLPVQMVGGTIWHYRFGHHVLEDVEITLEKCEEVRCLSDNEGFFILPIESGITDMFFSHDDFWSVELNDINIGEEYPVDVGPVVMTGPESEVNPTYMSLEFYMNETEPVWCDFTIENVGSGVLEYKILPPILAECSVENEIDTLSLKKKNRLPIVSNLDELWDPLDAFYNIDNYTQSEFNFGVTNYRNEYYVSDYENAKISKFTDFNNFIETVEIDSVMMGDEIAGFMGLTSDTYGYLYGGNDRGEIYKFLPDMSEISLVGTVPIFPALIACDYYDDGDGNYLYVSDFGNSFYRVADDGTYLSLTAPSDSIYGIAYNQIDIEGYTIYAHVLHEGSSSLIRYNSFTDCWNEDPVTNIYNLSGNERLGGMCFVLGVRDSKFVTLLQGENYDNLNLWDGGHHQPYISLSLEGGTLQPGSESIVRITVDPIDFELYEEMDITTFLAIIGPHTYDSYLLLEIRCWNGYQLKAEEDSDLPEEYALHQNYPNPFNPSTLINYDLVEAQDVRLSVYNLLGQEVVRLVDRNMDAGSHSVEFDASALAAGIYFYKLETPAYNSMKKMVLIK